MALMLGLTVSLSVISASADEKKTFVFGDTTFNAENEEADVNPQNTYAGWACIRYGIGETLFKYSDDMEIEPWIAKEFENVDELTWKITLNDGVVFSNGRACDGEAVKESLESLVANHERAAGDLCIDSIEADGNTVTIKTTEPKPALINYLCDPYGCIIDTDAGITEEGIVIGTGPYVVTDLVTDDHLDLVKNENYWAGDVNIDEITVRTISDGDTLAFALQAGEINAAYGMAYASYPLFENDDFTFTSTPTSRAFYAWMNFESPITSDPAVRQAIAMGIDKDSFVSVLLNGYGYPAVGAFPDTFSFGGQNLTTESYDPEGAKQVLEEAGWTDTDGDGIREIDGENINLRYISYENRLLNEFSDAHTQYLAEIGIGVTSEYGSSDDQWSKLAALDYDFNNNNWITVGTGDPFAYMANWATESTYCAYSNPEYDALYQELKSEMDEDKRADLIFQMQQILIDDAAVLIDGYYNSSMIYSKKVGYAKIHTADYYWLSTEIVPAE